MTVSIPLTPDIEQRVEAIAARTGRSTTAQLQTLVEMGLHEIEDYYLAADVRDRVRRGDEAVTSLDALERELGLAS